MTYNELRAMFPPRKGTSASTGFIPMEFVNENLDSIKVIVKDYSLRRIYRGPRSGSTLANTRKEDAYAMVLYRR